MAGPKVIRFTILGEPASKANSRQLVTRGARTAFVEEEDETGEKKRKKVRAGGRPMFIKSEKALKYEQDAIRQIPHHAKVMLEGPVKVTLRIFYASERSDLDESVILDVLQPRYAKVKGPLVKVDDDTYKFVEKKEMVSRGVYLNDRQVREKHVYHGIDRKKPRAEIEIEELSPGLFEPDSAGMQTAAAMEAGIWPTEGGDPF